MAGRQSVECSGLQFRIEPDFWLRRWLHFPLFFQHHNPTFRIKVRRIAPTSIPPTWQMNGIVLEVLFADNTITWLQWPCPELAVGESATLLSRPIFTAFPGQVILRLPIAPGRWETLFCYEVRTEESLWLGVVSVVWSLIMLAAGAGATRLVDAYL